MTKFLYGLLIVAPFVLVTPSDAKVIKLDKVNRATTPTGAPPPTDSQGERLLKMSSATAELPHQYMKFEPQLVKSLQDSSNVSNSDLLTSISSVYYVGPIEVGTQTFRVIYDTGSNLLWVPSGSCDSSCNGHPAFTGQAQSLSQDWTVTYGSGTVTGTYVTAPVSIADANLTSFKLGLANNVGFDGFNGAEFDGLLGLAWPSLNSEDNVPAIVPSLFTAGQSPANLFTMYLAADGSGGELSLGEIDTSRYQGNITWLPLILAEWWTVRLNGVSVGNQAVSGTGGTAILDSGTSLIAGPNDQVMNIMDAIQNSGVTVYYDQDSGLYAVRCSDVSSLPDLTFTLSGSDRDQYHYVMPGTAYVIKSLSNDPSVCPLAINGMSGGGSLDWILGDPFLRTFYSIYDYENQRAGLALAYPSAGSVTPGDRSLSGAVDMAGGLVGLALTAAALFIVL